MKTYWDPWLGHITCCTGLQSRNAAPLLPCQCSLWTLICPASRCCCKLTSYISVLVIRTSSGLSVVQATLVPSAACIASTRLATSSHNHNCKLLCDLLSDPQQSNLDGIYINYYGMNTANTASVSWNGSTFAWMLVWLTSTTILGVQPHLVFWIHPPIVIFVYP